MNTIHAMLAVGSGGIVGLSLGLLGGGGSILAVPLLLYVVGLKNPHVVIGTSAFAVSLNAYLSLIPHARAGHVKWKAAIALAIPGVLGAALGANLGHRANGSDLLFLFALLMIVIAVMMLRPRPHPSDPDRDADYIGNSTKAPDTRFARVIPTGLLVGGLSGFFGIGGGFLIVPGLVFSSGLAMIDAIGSSLVAVGTFGLTTAITYTFLGLINWLVLLEYTVGGVLGGYVGFRLATRLSQSRRALNITFSAVIIVVALYMLYRNLGVLHL